MTVVGLYFHNAHNGSIRCCNKLKEKPKALRSVTQPCSCMPIMPPS